MALPGALAGPGSQSGCVAGGSVVTIDHAALCPAGDLAAISPAPDPGGGRHAGRTALGEPVLAGGVADGWRGGGRDQLSVAAIGRRRFTWPFWPDWRLAGAVAAT